MSTNPESMDQVPPTDTADQTPPDETKSALLPIEIPPMIERSQAAFRRDLPELIKTHYYQWVAYHGDERIGFGRTETALYKECLRRGLKEDEFVVRMVAEDMPEEIDYFYWDVEEEIYEE
jgi:hypothetical protein